MSETQTDSRPQQKTDHGWQEFWQQEISASEKMLREFRTRGDEAVKVFTDKDLAGRKTWFSLNLFNSNINTLKSMLYGNLPEVTVERKFSDPDDDNARVASMMLQRALEQDLQEKGEDWDTVLRGVLEDRLIPGLGCAVVRYDSEIGSRVQIDSETEEETEEEYLEWEDCEVNYHYWGDVCWSWARNWSELRWVAFRSYLTRESAEKRFGKEKASTLTYKKQSTDAEDDNSGSGPDGNFVQTAPIWEIWDKESGQVFWYQSGQPGVLDKQEDPLGLEGFFPCPPFYLANPTTTHYLPTSDYYLARDLYNEINRLETRIATITEAVKVVGVYDKSADGVQRMLKEGTENDLIPVDNWALFSEKGGLQGTVDWFPVEDVAKVLRELVAQRDDQIALLYQITGMSDIMRGAGSQATVSATEQELKAKFSSIRVQALQDSFANYVSSLMQLKAEVICKHYEPQTILRMANVGGLNPADQQRVPVALELLKNPEAAEFRIVIKPESVAMVDFAKKQAERTEYIQALGFFMQSAAPIMTEEPGTTPFMLELLKWGLAGFKGSQEIEGVVDAAIESMLKQPPQKQEDPRAAAEQAKIEGQMQLQQQKHQNEMEKLNMQRQHDMQKHQFEMRETIAAHQTQMTEMMTEFRATMAEIAAKAGGDVAVQQAQTDGKLTETAVQTAAKLETMNAQVRARSQDSQTDSG